MNINQLRKVLVAGHAEVEDVVQTALRSSFEEAERFDDLARQRQQVEANAKRAGARSFPLSTWLAISATYLRGGYEALELQARKDKKVLPFVLGFCAEDKSSPDSWTCMERLAMDAGNWPQAQRKKLLECINEVFSFGQKSSGRAENFGGIHDFVLGQLTCGKNAPMALYAARGFPSQRMLDAVEATPEPSDENRSAKSLAVVAIKRALLKDE
jgi:hypothetical protein